jgi:hypothetical protein
MQRSATIAGPGISLSPATQRRTVRGSTANCRAASSCDQPSAAMAAVNCSGATANDPGVIDRQAGALAGRANGGQVVVNAEGVGKRAVSHEYGETFGPILAAADEADCIGGKGGADQGLAHADMYRAIGPTRQAQNAGRAMTRSQPRSRPDSADNRPFAGVSSYETSPLPAMAAGLFGSEA